MPKIRILLDNNVPIHLARLLRPHEAVHASARGWDMLGNGDLIRAAEADGFAVMITGDQNVQYQQNVSRRSLGLIVLTTTHWATIRDNVSLITKTLDTV